MTRKDGYYTKYRTLYNKETKEMREVYSPVIVVDGKELYISDGEKVMEFDSKYGAFRCARETYLKYEEKLKNDLKKNQ